MLRSVAELTKKKKKSKFNSRTYITGHCTLSLSLKAFLLSKCCPFDANWGKIDMKSQIYWVSYFVAAAFWGD